MTNRNKSKFFIQKHLVQMFSHFAIEIQLDKNFMKHKCKVLTFNIDYAFSQFQ